MKRFIYLISPQKIRGARFYNKLDQVLKTNKVKYFQLRLKKISTLNLIKISIKIKRITRKNNIKFFVLSDLVSIVAPIGLFFGRIANFINNELYGKITNFPFAMIYPEIDLQPRHPSQLYEAFLEGIILFVILVIYFNKTKTT